MNPPRRDANDLSGNHAGVVGRAAITPHVMGSIHALAYGQTMTVLTHDEFGQVLRTWRGRRRRSQLALASEAGVSQRHISFLETGKSRPSREMVEHLGIVLDVPLRERNAMLVSAGFAPVHPERSLDDPDMADIRRAIEAMLTAHNPFPAYVVNRRWDLLLANDAALSLVASLPSKVQELSANIARLVLHPDGLRGVVTNWQQVGAALLRRMGREIDENPADAALIELLAELEAYPGLPGGAELERVPVAHELLIPLTLRRGDRELRLFTAISTLLEPSDVTLDELRLETLLSADAATHEALRSG